jgi:hypothetical protein
MGEIGKKGSEKYYILMSLILGIIVLALSLWFIFNEYFNEDELDWEVCRQSIILRASLPEADLLSLETDLKGAFPLKCKTEVVTIDSVEPEVVYDKISRAVASGWYMFGEGKFDFVHRNFLKENYYCLAFARIHYTPEAIKEFNDLLDEGNSTSLKENFDGDFYYYYLGTKVPGSSKTYSEYLPIYNHYESEPILYWGTSVYPREEDILLVYRLNKYSSPLKTQWFNNWFTRGVATPWVWVENQFLDEEGQVGLYSVKELEAMEKTNSIAMVPINYADKIGCSEYLTIPA